MNTNTCLMYSIEILQNTDTCIFVTHRYMCDNLVGVNYMLLLLSLLFIIVFLSILTIAT